ncbi:MAG: SusE domain-containing protein [Reichenbachiella sp.]
MKLYKYLSIILFVFFISCEEESDTVVSGNVIAPIVTAPSEGESVVVTEDNMASEITISWDEADYGVDLEVTYIVQLDVKDNLFATAAVLSSTQESSVTLTHSQLNDIVIGDLNQDANAAADLEVRVVAKSTGFNDLNSDLIPLGVTTFLASGVPPVVTASDVAITSDILGNMYELTWTAADFGSSSEVTYEVSLTVDGETSAVLGSTMESSLSLNHEALNFYLVGNLDQANNTAVQAQFVVTAITATNELISEPVTASITTLNATVPGMLWVPGGYQDWDPSQAPTLIQTGDHSFDGFVYMALETGFKFTSHPDWDHTNFGFESDGILTKDGNAGGLTYGPGFMRYQVDTSALTYTATFVESFGLIGTATAGGWDLSTPMTYDETLNAWVATADLIAGAMKFRADDEWAINYGVGDINSRRGQLYFDGASYDVKEDGSYTVTLSFDTKTTPYQFNYEIIKN